MRRTLIVAFSLLFALSDIVHVSSEAFAQRGSDQSSTTGQPTASGSNRSNRNRPNNNRPNNNRPNNNRPNNNRPNRPNRPTDQFRPGRGHRWRRGNHLWHWNTHRRIFWHHYAFLWRPPVGAYWVYVDGYYLLISSASGRVLDVVIAH